MLFRSLVANEALSQLSYSPTTYLSYQRAGKGGRELVAFRVPQWWQSNFNRQGGVWDPSQTVHNAIAVCARLFLSCGQGQDVAPLICFG